MRTTLLLLFLLLAGASGQSVATVTTLAGSHGYGYADGPGLSSTFSNPWGISTNGTIALVSDEESHLVRQIVLSTGIVTSVAGLAGSNASSDGIGSNAQFDHPHNVALNAAGTFAVVACGSTYQVRSLFLPSGLAMTLAGRFGISGHADGVGSAATFTDFDGIALNGAGTLAVIGDSGNFIIRSLDIASATVTTLAGSAGRSGYADGVGAAARFTSVNNVAIDAAGANVFVADRAVVRILSVASGAVTTLAGSQVNLTRSFNYTGGGGGRGITNRTRYAGNYADGVGTNAAFHEVVAVGVNPAGSVVYVVDSPNQLIRSIVVSTAVVSTIAGSFNVSGSADGVGTTATFFGPRDVSVDPTGNFLVIVEGTPNNDVRLVTFTSSSPLPSTSSASGLSQAGVIAVAVIIPIAGLVIIAVVLLIVCARRRGNRAAKPPPSEDVKLAGDIGPRPSVSTAIDVPVAPVSA